MNIEELCDEVNRVLRERGINVPDGRTASVVTPRNVRYYRTIGMLAPPRRSEGRAEYDASHVDEVVAIKTAQSEGVSLEELKLKRQSSESGANEPETDARRLWSSVVASKSQVFPVAYSRLDSQLVSLEPTDRRSAEQPRTSDGTLGWSVRVGDITVSGPGVAPSQSRIEQIIRALSDDD